MVFVTLSPPEPGPGRTARIALFFIGVPGRNGQFGFSAATELAPDLESASNEFGPFPHTTESPMSGNLLLAENDWVDAFSVIPDSESQVVFTVSEFDLDSSSMCVTDSISQGLHSNPKYLVTKDGTEGQRCSLNLNTQLGTRFTVDATQKLLAEFAYRLAQIRRVQSAGAELMHC